MSHAPVKIPLGESDTHRVRRTLVTSEAGSTERVRCGSPSRSPELSAQTLRVVRKDTDLNEGVSG